MTAGWAERVKHVRRSLRGRSDEAINEAAVQHAERFIELWKEGGSSLVAEALRMKQAVLEYSGSNPVLLSVQGQA